MPFDPDTLKVLGDEAPVLEGVQKENPLGSNIIHWSYSQTGLLAYRPGGSFVPMSRLVWVDREGEIVKHLTDAKHFSTLQLSNDGKRLAYDVLERGRWQISVHDLERDVPRRISIPGHAFKQIWSKDDQGLYFTRFYRTKGFALYYQSLTKSDDAVEIVDSERDEGPLAGAHTSNTIIAWQMLDGDNYNFIAVNPDGPESDKVKILLGGRPRSGATLSPQDDWIAWVVEDNGRGEINVVRFPEMTNSVRISTHGGRDPQWSPDGTEIFFLSQGNMMTVPVDIVDDTIEIGEPKVLFSFKRFVVGIFGEANKYDYNGEHFILKEFVDPLPRPQIIVVPKGMSELERLAPHPEKK